MGDIATPGAPGLRRSGRRRGSATGSGIGLRLLRVAAPVIAAALFAGCTPDYDWRDSSGPGGGYRVQLPARPTVMTRRIHLEGLEVEMTMQGAKVRDNAFTIARVPLPPQPAQVAGMSPERILAAMREQMLRNIGASPTIESTAAAADLIDAEGRKVGKVPLQAVSAQGTGRHAGMALRGRFGLWQGNALQIVAVGPDMDPEQAEHFLDSLRLVRQ